MFHYKKPIKFSENQIKGVKFMFLKNHVSKIALLSGLLFGSVWESKVAFADDNRGCQDDLGNSGIFECKFYAQIYNEVSNPSHYNIRLSTFSTLNLDTLEGFKLTMGPPNLFAILQGLNNSNEISRFGIVFNFDKLGTNEVRVSGFLNDTFYIRFNPQEQIDKNDSNQGTYNHWLIESGSPLEDYNKYLYSCFYKDNSENDKNGETSLPTPKKDATCIQYNTTIVKSVSR